MEHWKRLGWPLLLGALAAIVNWYNVTSRLEPRYYVVADRHIQAGELVKREWLRCVGISGDHGLARTAFPWSQRAILYDWRSTRSLRPGDLILQRDVTPARDRQDISPDEVVFTINVRDVTMPQVFAGDLISFALGSNSNGHAPAVGVQPEGDFPAYGEASRQVGPFRIWALGERFSQANDQGRGGGDLTLCVPRYPSGEEKMTRLLNALNGRGHEFVLTVLQHAEVHAAPETVEEPTLADGEFGTDFTAHGY